jgi:hypothetical protein
MLDGYDKYALERLMEKVVKGEECWIFTGYIDYWGYGRIGYKGKVVPAHRLAYHLMTEPVITKEKDNEFPVHHKCPNKACVNPQHLKRLTSKAHFSKHLMSLNGRITKK